VIRVPYAKGIDRNQMFMCSLDGLVPAQSVARIIDAFTASLDLAELGFAKAEL
jgi:hypothetical protein